MTTLYTSSTSSTRRHTWIAFSRAFTSFSSFSSFSSQRRWLHTHTDDDSGLSSPVGVPYGARLPRRSRRVAVSSSGDTNTNTQAHAYIEKPSTPTTHSSHRPPLLFTIRDQLAYGTELNELNELNERGNTSTTNTPTKSRKQRQAMKRALLEAGEHVNPLKQPQSRQLAQDTHTPNSPQYPYQNLHPRSYQQVSLALQRHSRRQVREALSAFPPQTLFHDSTLASILTVGLVQTRDVKGAAWYLEQLGEGVQLSEAAFVALLDGVPAERMGRRSESGSASTKQLRDQGRARRSSSFPPPYCSLVAQYQWRRLATLIDGVKPPQQALVNVLPLLALQRGLYVWGNGSATGYDNTQTHTRTQTNPHTALAVLRWLLRTGYDDSAALFVEEVLSGWEGSEHTKHTPQITSFALHSLNLLLKSLSHSHGDPAGPKFQERYKPYKYYKDASPASLQSCKQVVDFFCRRVPSLRLNGMTHAIVEGVRRGEKDIESNMKK
ncbi:hypothetical protein J056_001274 [Wallemia ichthyophaga EXF-994]|uniref:Uncharacterized protein n=1 Tax=Wallemia ichthyophaga (strain EXF-994 / CBS 113033) TaxID=1299270 RepID=R9AD64_WALI9|nr:uncharacterized protein J056_001274 [Wallemia ichthyophaga EXF-994]EOR00045.1 hypothetical protein J056_001274 [Wallemia ichthyophaga EXF-994]TIB34296.1 hypothetical protein E3P84_01848 [Wallemia ichthyophaga]TIB41631.1 hypothetical protein E3P83_01799 [Wallemia ichthyophaga]